MDSSANLKKLASAADLAHVIRSLAAWRRAASPRQVDAFFTCGACTVLLSNVLQQFMPASQDASFRRLLASLLSSDSADVTSETQAAGSAASSIASAVRAAIAKLQEAAGPEPDAGYKARIATAVIATATRLAAAALAFRQQLRHSMGGALAGADQEAEAEEAASKLQAALAQASQLVKAGALPATYASALEADATAVSGACSEELRYLVAQHVNTSVLTEIALDTLAFTVAGQADAPAATVTASDSLKATFDSGVSGLAGSASASSTTEVRGTFEA